MQYITELAGRVNKIFKHCQAFIHERTRVFFLLLFNVFVDGTPTEGAVLPPAELEGEVRLDACFSHILSLQARTVPF